jgi:hypothetical protein
MLAMPYSRVPGAPRGGGGGAAPQGDPRRASRPPDGQKRPISHHFPKLAAGAHNGVGFWGLGGVLMVHFCRAEIFCRGQVPGKMIKNKSTSPPPAWDPNARIDGPEDDESDGRLARPFSWDNAMSFCSVMVDLSRPPRGPLLRSWLAIALPACRGCSGLRVLAAGRVLSGRSSAVDWRTKVLCAHSELMACPDTVDGLCCSCPSAYAYE